MTSDELMTKILEIFPNAIIDEEYGTKEIVIATGVMLKDGEVIPMPGL
jgi:hypothetical protein